LLKRTVEMKALILIFRLRPPFYQNRPILRGGCEGGEFHRKPHIARTDGKIVIGDTVG
jgi:hypothetical protein